MSSRSHSHTFYYEALRGTSCISSRGRFAFYILAISLTSYTMGLVEKVTKGSPQVRVSLGV